MYVPRRLLVALFALVLFTRVFGQTPNLQPNTPGDKPLPTVSFDLVLPGASPAHYAISVNSMGRAAYRSDDLGPGPAKEVSTGDPYSKEFTMSAPTRTRIFELARQANYFKGNFDYTRHRIANTGAKTLSYSEGPADALGKPTIGLRNSTTYNYSENQAIQQLTEIFQNISNSMELGRRLEFLRRFDKLGIDDELKRAEELAQQNRLLELQAIQPALRDVIHDFSIMHIARQRAQNLLNLSEPVPPPKSAQNPTQNP